MELLDLTGVEKFEIMFVRRLAAISIIFNTFGSPDASLNEPLRDVAFSILVECTFWQTDVEIEVDSVTFSSFLEGEIFDWVAIAATSMDLIESFQSFSTSDTEDMKTNMMSRASARNFVSRELTKIRKTFKDYNSCYENGRLGFVELLVERLMQDMA